MKNDLEKTIEISEMKTPPFRYYFVVSFVLAAFMLVLDGIYRSDAFLTRTGIIQLIANGIFLWLPLFFLLLLLSIPLWGIDTLTKMVLFRKNKSSDSGEIKFVNYVSGFIYYSVFAYFNIIYFRLYISSFIPGIMKDGELMGIGKIVTVSLVVALLIYIFSVRKFFYSKTLRDMVNRLFKPALAVFVIFCLVFASVFLFQWKDKAIRMKGDLQNKKEKPHILIITMDNLRAANMSLYGYELDTTPFLDKYANECSVFDNMMGASTQTLTSMPVIITGKYYGRQFPCHSSYYKKSLPIILDENGYKKRCFISQLSMNLFPRKMFTDYVILNDLKGDPVRNLSWLGKSLESLVWFSQFFSEDERFFNIYSIRDPRDIDYHRTESIMTAAGEYIVRTMKESKKPVFIWAHFMKTHPPYNPPEIFKEHFKQSYNPEFNKYNASIRYIDYELGNIIKRLKAEGLYDNTMIILTSDHGCYFESEFMANQIRFDKSSHRSYLRYTTPITNIPLIIHEPGQNNGRKVSVIANQSDIAPTILELAGIKASGEMDGESLVPYIRNQKQKSDKIKITVPGEYYYLQNDMAFNDEANIEYINLCAYYDHYAIEFSQRQPKKKAADKKILSTADEEFPLQLIGVYNLLYDKDHKNNLIEQKGMKMLAEKVLDSPLVKYYGDIGRKSSPKN